jgi:hypothetical protein
MGYFFSSVSGSPCPKRADNTQNEKKGRNEIQQKTSGEEINQRGREEYGLQS